MRIYCNKKSDLIAERDAYDAETQKYQDIVDEASRSYRQKLNEASDNLRAIIANEIGQTSLPLIIGVNRAWREGWEVSIQVDKYNGEHALNWDWSVQLDGEGNIKKDSGSWSGLNAVTAEQIDDLKESVRVLTILNDIDWEPIISAEIPDADVDDSDARIILRDRRANRKDYNRLILDAELEEAAEEDKWIKLEGRPETSYYRGATRSLYWCKILKLTDNFVTCRIQWDSGSGKPDESRSSTEERIKKDNLYKHIVQPIETY